MFDVVVSSIMGACKAITDTLPTTVAGQFWYWVQTVWHNHGLIITIGLTLWVIFEIATRGKGIHFDSKNGFSPPFNVLVGSGVYWLLQWLLYLLFHWIFGDAVYCYLWPLPIHAWVFKSTKRLLIVIGFWVY